MNIYSENNIELVRIEKYRIYKPFIIAWIFSTLVTFLLFCLSGAFLIAIFILLFSFLGLGLRLWTKHRLICPNCKKNFYGPFELFKKYTSNCHFCNFSYIPTESVNLNINRI